MLRKFTGLFLVLALVIAACTPSSPPAVQVASVSPVSGASGVSVDTTVSTVFGSAMNADTLNTSFRLVSTDGPVGGDLSYNADTLTATFTPSADLAYDTEYTATWATTVRTSAGGRLAAVYSWSFTTESEPGPTPAVTAVTVTPASAGVVVGGSTTYTATVAAVGGAPTTVTWASSDETVATVDAFGVVTGVSVGTADITATSTFNTAVSGSATVSVATAPAVFSVTVAPATATLEYGETVALTPDVDAAGGASEAVTWTTSDEAVATVNADGEVTAVSAGTATITATSAFDTDVSGTSAITVLAPAVTGVVVTPNPTAALTGETVQFAAAVTAISGASTDVTWSTSDAAVATVDANGEVSALTVGEVQITATSVFNPAISGAATLTVTDAPAVTNVSVSPESADLELNETLALTATVVAVGGADESLTWTSNNPAVATVDADGEVTAVSAGTATITATSDFDTDVSGASTITVLETEVTGITVEYDESQILEVGDTVDLGAEATAVSGANPALTYVSSDPSVATVNEDGQVTAVGPGTATITITSVNNPEISITVTINVAGVSSVVVTPPTSDLIIGATEQLAAAVTAHHGASTAVTWSSGDEAIATVDADGLVTAVAPGTVTITATATDNGVTGTASITVLTPAVNSVAVEPDTATIALSATQQYAATVVAVNGASDAVTWSSSNTAVATVDGTGLVTPVAPGTATITASSVFNPAVTGTATVNVSGVTSVTVDPATADLAVTGTTTAQLTATVVALHGASDAVTWSSSNDAVATVDGTGLVTAVAPGTATITATSVDNATISGSAVITVHPAVTMDHWLDIDLVAGTGVLNVDLGVTGGLAPYSYAFSVDLPAGFPVDDVPYTEADLIDLVYVLPPAGIELDAVNGALVGSTEAGGFFRFFVQVTDSLGQVDYALAEMRMFLALVYASDTYTYPLGCGGSSCPGDFTWGAIPILNPAYGSIMDLGDIEVFGASGTVTFSGTLISGTSSNRWAINSGNGAIGRRGNGLLEGGNTTADHNGTRTYRVTARDTSFPNNPTLYPHAFATFDVTFEVE